MAAFSLEIFCLKKLIEFTSIQKDIQSNLTWRTLLEGGHLSLADMSRSHHRILLFNLLYQAGPLLSADADSNFWSQENFPYLFLSPKADTVASHSAAYRQSAARSGDVLLRCYFSASFDVPRSALQRLLAPL